MDLLFVGVGGFFGAMSRYAVYLSLSAWQGFPTATLLVNVIGCFLIGVIVELNIKFNWIESGYYLIATTGFLGGFTTFSAFGLETIRLIGGGNSLMAIINIVANVGLGLLAVVAAKFIV